MMRQSAAAWHKAWLGLGGNIGNVEANFRYALRRLAENNACRLLDLSALYRSKAWGRENQPDFLNACAALETCLSPHALLRLCQKIEKEKKRERAEKWGPRSLDIDILIYEGYQSGGADNSLILPHPYLAERVFTVLPLAEISPDLPLNGINFRKRARVMQEQGLTSAIEKLAKSDNWYKL